MQTLNPMTINSLLFLQLKEKIKQKDFESAEQILRQMHSSGYPASLIRSSQNLVAKESQRLHQSAAESSTKHESTHHEKSPKPSDLKIRELKAFGSAILGPSISLFYHRLATKTSYAQQSPSNLYFLAREGYLLQRGYDRLQNTLRGAANSKYLVTSRVLMFRALLEDQRVFPLICSHNYSGTLEGLLQSRCGLNKEEIQTLTLDSNLFPNGLPNKVELPSDAPKLIQLIEQNADTIKSYSTATKNAYLQYLDELGINAEKRVHVVDLGYSGTIQKCLSILTEKPVVGHYLITTPAAKNTRINKFIGHLFSNRAWGSGCSLLDLSLILEALLTAPSGSAQGVQYSSKGIEFTYGLETKSQDCFELLEYIFEGCIDYCQLNYKLNNTFSPSEVDIMYRLATCTKNSTMPDEAFNMLEVEDSFSGLGVINPSSLYSN